MKSIAKNNGVLLLDKPLGISPLDAIGIFKKEHPEYEHEKIGYAGRLDPMATGLLLCLVGEENKKREEYLNLDKTYEVRFILGIKTDSFDILGKVENIDKKNVENAERISKNEIEETLASFTGDIMQKFPPFSSKTINGRPLYYWAREGTLISEDIPVQKRTIHSIELKEFASISGEDLLIQIDEKLKHVKGNFRQDEIISLWKDELTGALLDTSINVGRVEISCSSGTYMRQLIQDIGEKLRCGACVLSIHRTKVGEYSIKDMV